MSAQEDFCDSGDASRAPHGDSWAPEQLFARYVQRLVRLADQQLSQRLAARLDAEDVVQSAFRSFFRRDAGGEFQIDNSIQLWRLLVKITLDKARTAARRHQAERRNVAAEVQTGEALLEEAITREPSPDEAAALTDQIDTLIRGLPDLYAQVLDMRLAGHSAGEIAGTLGISRQTVYRALHTLQQRLLRDLPASNG